MMIWLVVGELCVEGEMVFATGRNLMVMTDRGKAGLGYILEFGPADNTRIELVIK